MCPRRGVDHRLPGAGGRDEYPGDCGRLRHDADPVDRAVLIHLVGTAVAARPRSEGPVLDPGRRIWRLVVRPRVVERILLPRLEDHLEVLVVDLAVAGVGHRIHRRGRYSLGLAQGLHPPGLVSAGEGDPHPSRVHVVEEREVLCRPNRVRGAQDDRHRHEHEPLGERRELCIEEQVVRDRLAPSVWKWCSVVPNPSYPYSSHQSAIRSQLASIRWYSAGFRATGRSAARSSGVTGIAELLHTNVFNGTPFVAVDLRTPLRRLTTAYALHHNNMLKLLRQHPVSQATRRSVPGSAGATRA